MEKLDYCYHTHTYRCGHAVGHEEEYILYAIKAGIKRLGFSDHMILPKGYEHPGMRGSYDMLEGYISSLEHLKEKYKGVIEIHIGFESEYIPELLPYYKRLLDEGRVEYLILGQHLYYENGEHRWYDLSIEFDKYLEHVLKGLDTGLFTYLAHPDLFMLGHKDLDEKLEIGARKILKKCEELDIPIEINGGGLRRRNYDENHWYYPNAIFWEIAKEYKVRIIIGIDSHRPEEMSIENINKCVDFAKRHGIPFPVFVTNAR